MSFFFCLSDTNLDVGVSLVIFSFQLSFWLYHLNGGYSKVKWNHSFKIKLISSQVELDYLVEGPKEAVEYRSHLCAIFVV